MTNTEMLDLAKEIYKQQIAKQSEAQGVQSFSLNMCQMIASKSLRAAEAFKIESERPSEEDMRF